MTSVWWILFCSSIAVLCLLNTSCRVWCKASRALCHGFRWIPLVMFAFLCYFNSTRRRFPFLIIYIWTVRSSWSVSWAEHLFCSDVPDRSDTCSLFLIYLFNSTKPHMRPLLDCKTHHQKSEMCTTGLTDRLKRTPDLNIIAHLSDELKYYNPDIIRHQRLTLQGFLSPDWHKLPPDMTHAPY